MSRFCVESAATAGHANASFLPHSVDLEECHPVAGVGQEYDLCFVGNVTNWGNGEGGRRSGMNMRVLEVPATGAFLLTDGSRELGEFLTTGTHVATYEGVDEFAARIEYWLARPDECARIAEQGRAHVAAHYSYDGLVHAFVERYRTLHSASLADGMSMAGRA